MSNEFANQEVFNADQDLEETGEEVDNVEFDEGHEDEEFRNDWHDDPIDCSE